MTAAIDSGRPVDASEIRWAPERVPAPDLCGTSDEDVLVKALSEGESYRTLAQCAIHRLHDLEAERDTYKRKYFALLDAYRALRKAA